jgi:hypothetical protein
MTLSMSLSFAYPFAGHPLFLATLSVKIERIFPIERR